jgi:cytochrome P450
MVWHALTLLAQKNQYIHDLEGLAKADGLGIVFPNITKIASYLPLPLFNAAKASKTRLASYAAESIGRYEKLVAAEPDNTKLTLLTKLFNPKEETLRRIDILAAAQGYIIAGSDTTANSLTYLLWAVCRNPSIRARLAEEVAGLPETYRDEDLKTLPYLSQVIKETLRLYGAAPAFLPREVTQGGAEIDGYWMPAGTEVQTQAYSMHRDATVFPDPERFNPSRWESPSREMQDAWMPFGGGARSTCNCSFQNVLTDEWTVCLGLHLALMEMRLAVAGFFRAFPNAKAAMRDGFNDEEMEQVIFFLMFPKGKRCMIQAS